MDAGKLDRIIVIEKGTPGKNKARETTFEWAAFAKPWANYSVPNSRQVFNSQQLQSEIDAVFTIRFRTDIDPKEAFRVVYRGRYYRVKGARETGARNTFLALDCTSRAE